MLLLPVCVSLLGATPDIDASTTTTASRSQDGAEAGWIAYSKSDGHIWVVDADGRRAHRVTFSPSERDIDPSWSPNGQRIVFKAVPASAAPDSRASAIVVTNRDGSGRHAISPMQDVESPSWSPDGKLIAFQLKGRIALVHPDGSGLEKLPIHGGCPSWAPNSQLIAICGDDGGIYTINRDGRGWRLLTKKRGAMDVPGPWSHDGKRLSFVREHGREGDIYAVADDGSHLTRVTSFPGTEAPNAWLKSGMIVFPLYNSGDNARWFAVRSDGRGLKRLPQLKIAFDPIDWHE